MYTRGRMYSKNPYSTYRPDRLTTRLVVQVSHKVDNAAIAPLKAISIEDMAGKRSSRTGKGKPPTKIIMDPNDPTHSEDENENEVINESSNEQISSDSDGNSEHEGSVPSEENPTQNPPRESQTGSKDWSAEDEGQLVEMWRNEEYLYNKALPDYRNALKKDIAIKRIATNLNKEG